MHMTILGRSSALLLFALSTTVAAQTGYSPVRTPWGHPDIQGVWNFATPTPLERPAALGDKAVYTDEEFRAFEREAAPLTQGAGGDRDQRNANPVIDVELAYNEAWSERGQPLRRTSLITDPPDGRIPLRADVQGRLRAAPSQAEQGRRGSDSWLDRSLWERCITRSGLPRVPGTYNNNVQIIQTRDTVVLLYEMIHEARIIPLNGGPHLNPRIQQWLGDARGRWEGNTLVVETTNFTDKTPFNGAGAHMRLVERFTPTAPTRIDYRFTVEDESTFTRSWSAELPFRRIRGPIYEYACHEGNYGLLNLLAGARAQEREAAQPKK